MPLDDTMRQFPASRTKARDAAALAYYQAGVTKRRALSDANMATKDAIKAGVMFDHVKYPREPGTDCVVYDGDVRIALKVGEQGEKLDVPAFIASLVAEGVKPSLIKRLASKHTYPTAAPHIFTASLVE